MRRSRFAVRATARTPINERVLVAFRIRTETGPSDLAMFQRRGRDSKPFRLVARRRVLPVALHPEQVAEGTGNVKPPG